MNKIKVFKTTNKELPKMELIINNWAESENVEIIQFDIASAASYSSTTFSKSYTTEVEMFITILYKE